MLSIFILVLCSGVLQRGDGTTIVMENHCGRTPFVLDGNDRPGLFVQLTKAPRYKPNAQCTMRVRTAETSQRLIVTVEKLEIKDCLGDRLKIFDNHTLLNTHSNQQCGTRKAAFYFLVTTNDE